MRNIHTNHQRSGRAQGQRRSQDPSPAEFRDDGWPCMLQPCHPQRYVSTDDANGVTAQRVARARRRSRGREEHQKRGGPERGKDERRLEEHRQPAKDADTDEPVHEHEERPYRANLLVRITFARTCCCPVADNRSLSVCRCARIFWNSAFGIRRSVVSSYARRLALRRPEWPGNKDCSPT